MKTHLLPWAIAALVSLGCANARAPAESNAPAAAPVEVSRPAAEPEPHLQPPAKPEVHDQPPVEPPKAGSPPPPRRKRPPPPPPPQEIAGEGPCRKDSDCAVGNGRSCCGCETIEVTSRLHQRPPPPACGCGDLGAQQRLSGLLGDESPSGPCGRMPPPADDYRAVCRQAACVGVRR